MVNPYFETQFYDVKYSLSDAILFFIFKFHLQQDFAMSKGHYALPNNMNDYTLYMKVCVHKA